MGIEQRCVTFVTNMLDYVKETFMKLIATDLKTMLLQGLQGTTTTQYEYNYSASVLFYLFVLILVHLLQVLNALLESLSLVPVSYFI